MMNTKEKNRMPYRSVVGRLNLNNWHQTKTSKYFMGIGTAYTRSLPKKKNRQRRDRKK